MSERATKLKADIIDESVPVSIVSATDDLTFRYDVVGNVVYLGEAQPGSATSGAVWKVMKFDSDAESILFADGNKSFDNVWDDRVSLSYS